MAPRLFSEANMISRYRMFGMITKIKNTSSEKKGTFLPAVHYIVIEKGHLFIILGALTIVMPKERAQLCDRISSEGSSSVTPEETYCWGLLI